MESWTCPECTRKFARKGQRHVCGTGEADVVRGRSPEIAATYAALAKLAEALGPVELVTRERYVLFRTKRIFMDAVIMTDAVRLAIHLPRRVESDLFIKVVEDRRHVTHVVKLRERSEVAALAAWLREAHAHSLRER